MGSRWRLAPTRGGCVPALRPALKASEGTGGTTAGTLLAALLGGAELPGVVVPGAGVPGVGLSADPGRRPRAAVAAGTGASPPLSGRII